MQHCAGRSIRSMLLFLTRAGEEARHCVRLTSQCHLTSVHADCLEQAPGSSAAAMCTVVPGIMRAGEGPQTYHKLHDEAKRDGRAQISPGHTCYFAGAIYRTAEEDRKSQRS